MKSKEKLSDMTGEQGANDGRVKNKRREGKEETTGRLWADAVK